MYRDMVLSFNIFRKKKNIPENTPDTLKSQKETGFSADAGNKDKSKDTSSMWSDKGNSLIESSMYAEAITCFNKALEINPGSAEVWNNKGLALARTERHAEAIQCYDKALELKPGDSEVMYNKGIALAQLGRSSEAIECYDKMLGTNPRDSDAWCSKGDVLFESGRHEEALLAYDKSTGINPKNETAWNNRGLALVKLNRLPEAIESYDKALEINPKIEKIWSNKGLAIAKMRETEKKIDLQNIPFAFQVDEKQIPNFRNPEIVTNKKEPESGSPGNDSVIGPSSGLEKQPASMPIEEKSSLLIQTNHVENPGIVPEIEGVLPGIPGKAPLQSVTNVSTILEKVIIPVQEDGDKIIPVIENRMEEKVTGSEKPEYKHEAIPKETNVNEAQKYLVSGNSLFSQGKYREAIESFNKALQIDAENATAWNNKGLSHVKSGKIDEGIDCYNKALDINRGDYIVLNNKGSAFYKKGNVSEALKCYKTAFLSNSDSKAAMRGMEICLKYHNAHLH
ncbi:Photosystem I assembly protein Ycf3 [uncultured archaeon]|nr:Photosystem I assembly protein Ycf3 [uncultured archaeon]